jgi:hypothetical protein
MSEIVLRRHSRISCLRRRVRCRGPLLVMVTALAGATGLASALVALGPASDVMLTLPPLRSTPAVVAPVVPVAPVAPEPPAADGDERDAVRPRDPQPTGSAASPVVAAVDTSGAEQPENAGDHPPADAADPSSGDPGPGTPPAPPEPPPSPEPPPPAPEQPEQPEQPPPSQPPAPEEPDPVGDVVDDVTDLVPATEPVGDLVSDLLDPHD